ncbi:hypothetical protein SM0020_17332 [Sinorhizobium meliloti CCNWSX0020]|uniref:Uncharacterized protein n=1 Tax=Sinorhizobium meliloti CCNWSX0020 TaxID=1107881 RepID=H0G1X6_RHIML|nr:hypothetical protein SM0020_17332 [Sinorhizobium meliloti CCNWSX0020]
MLSSIMAAPEATISFTGGQRSRMLWFDTVPRRRHLNIGEHQIDVCSRLKDAICFLSIASLQRFVARRQYQIDGTHSDHRTVFHDQDDRFAVLHCSLDE